MIEKANHSIHRSHHSREAHDRLIHNGRQHEMKLWNSGYNQPSYVAACIACNDPQKIQAIEQCRDNYNSIREQLGLDYVTDWEKRPQNLIQQMR